MKMRLTNSIDDLLFFITSIRESDEYVKEIFLYGSCYQFHLLLKKFVPDAEPRINKEKNHIVTKFQGLYFDIRGLVNGDFYPLTESDFDLVSKWSFRENNLLKLTECPACDEPIVYN